MGQLGRQAALGIALAVVVLAIGWRAMPSRTPLDSSAQQRTPVDVASLGPQVGEQVPAFSLPDQNGQMQTLESVLGPRGGMLLFHRSADW